MRMRNLTSTRPTHARRRDAIAYTHITIITVQLAILDVTMIRANKTINMNMKMIHD